MATNESQEKPKRKGRRWLKWTAILCLQVLVILITYYCSHAENRDEIAEFIIGERAFGEVRVHRHRPTPRPTDRPFVFRENEPASKACSIFVKI